jgi:hypothetical protein
MSNPNSPNPSNEEDSNIVKSYDPPVTIKKMYKSLTYPTMMWYLFYSILFFT